MAGTNYVLDANVYIGAYRTYYAFDLVDGFWKLLLKHAKTGRIVSIDRILDELKDGKDPLGDWACNECSVAFVKTDRPDVIHHYGTMINWVQAMDFTPEAKTEFALKADGWVIAYAKAGGHKLVTHEKYEPNRKNKVKIPNVCKQFGIEYCDTFDMLRELGEKIG